MTANIIYHLFDEYTAYMKVCVDERKAKYSDKAVFPAIVEIIKGSVFNNKKPILVGMRVKHGILKVGTPLCVPDKAFIKIGKVTGIQSNKKAINEARPETGDISVKIEGDENI